MGKTVRKVSMSSKKVHKNTKDMRKQSMTLDEYLLKLRIQNLNSGVSEW